LAIHKNVLPPFQGWLCSCNPVQSVILSCWNDCMSPFL
jgi:hypothetical protein